MRLTTRRLGASEPDAELVVLVVLGTCGVMVAAWLLLRLPTPACVFHAVTGVPCLTCGGTRCLRHLLAGQMDAAFAWNPLVFLTAATAAVSLLYAAAVTAFRLPRVRIASLTPRESLGLRIGLAVVAAANWIYLIYRFSRPA